MTSLNTVRKGFRAIWNTGVTADIRPEEAKHIRFVNIGAFLLCAVNLAFFLLDFMAGRVVPIISGAGIAAAVLVLLVYRI